MNLLNDNKSEDPIIYNIESTNQCLMDCIFCSRQFMDRKIETMGLDDFENIVNQIKPHSKKDWDRWKDFVKAEYHIKDDEQSENHFFTNILAGSIIQVHGYGDPLLDFYMPQRIKMLKDRGLESYFSTNPSSINIKKTEEIMAAGLDYLKFSIESIYDSEQKRIRGKKTSFTKSYKDICALLDLKKEKGYGTTIVITMIDIGKEGQEKEFNLLKEKFKEKDVYLYKKSEDTQWLKKDKHKNNSIHWGWSFCKHPWMTMTIKSNCESTSCMECYTNLNVFGNTQNNTLKEIWNGEKYQRFRKDHVYGNYLKQCTNSCDMKLVKDII